MQPKYPIYIPSKGRPNCMTARWLLKDGLQFYIVIEPQDAESYSKLFSKDQLLILPFANLGQGSIPARNWIKQHSIAAGHERHWQLDDNIGGFYSRLDARRKRVDGGTALMACEEFSDRFENVAISGLNYKMFVREGQAKPPYYLNTKVYPCTLVNNSIPHQWRGRYNEDTDLCLQVLADGWCTLLLNSYLCNKMVTMRMKGGNTDELYKGNGRLKMAKELERNWPGIVTTRVRFGRPQHVVKDSWRCFKTPLKPRAA